jgi:hypothetical protein
VYLTDWLTAGYVHVPNTQRLGFKEFHRYYLIECQREGIIVDGRQVELNQSTSSYDQLID